MDIARPFWFVVFILKVAMALALAGLRELTCLLIVSSALEALWKGKGTP
jgi:hypothetical protein